MFEDKIKELDDIEGSTTEVSLEIADLLWGMMDITHNTEVRRLLIRILKSFTGDDPDFPVNIPMDDYMNKLKEAAKKSQWHQKQPRTICAVSEHGDYRNGTGSLNEEVDKRAENALIEDLKVDTNAYIDEQDVLTFSKKEGFSIHKEIN